MNLVELSNEIDKRRTFLTDHNRKTENLGRIMGLRNDLAVMENEYALRLKQPRQVLLPGVGR